MLEIAGQEIADITMFASATFVVERESPKDSRHQGKKREIGRPGDQERETAFSELVREIENNEYDSLTVNDCIRIMSFKLKGAASKPYGRTYMQKNYNISNKK